MEGNRGKWGELEKNGGKWGEMRKHVDIRRCRALHNPCRMQLEEAAILKMLIRVPGLCH